MIIYDYYFGDWTNIIVQSYPYKTAYPQHGDARYPNFCRFLEEKYGNQYDTIRNPFGSGKLKIHPEYMINAGLIFLKTEEELLMLKMIL